jgi:hypothetical protein
MVNRGRQAPVSVCEAWGRTTGAGRANKRVEFVGHHLYSYPDGNYPSTSSLALTCKMRCSTYYTSAHNLELDDYAMTNLVLGQRTHPSQPACCLVQPSNTNAFSTAMDAAVPKRKVSCCKQQVVRELRSMQYTNKWTGWLKRSSVGAQSVGSPLRQF